MTQRSDWRLTDFHLFCAHLAMDWMIIQFSLGNVSLQNFKKVIQIPTQLPIKKTRSRPLFTQQFDLDYS
jgi:hypothetical protein